LGWNECRARARIPIEWTSQAQWVTLNLLRLVQLELESSKEQDWWSCPPWNRKKTPPSVLDVERLLGHHSKEIRQLLSDWLGVGRKSA